MTKSDIINLVERVHFQAKEDDLDREETMELLYEEINEEYDYAL